MKIFTVPRVAVFGAAVIALAGFLAWEALRPPGLPKGFAGSNGRIEAVEIDVAAKTAGRIKDILVNEGDLVTAGQVLARMDAAVPEAQRREAEAQLQRALIGVDTAHSQIAQRQAEKDAAEAVVAQAKAELGSAEKRLARTTELTNKGTAAVQTLDDDTAQFQSARAGVSAAVAKVAATDAAISLAKSEAVGAESAVKAAQATIERIQADIDDGVLKAPRDGRVQYRVVQPGEVVSGGGKVLNLVVLSDVYMTFFLPTDAAGRVAMDAEARIVIDAAAQYVIPATVYFVADVAQFTPKTVETAIERQKLMFRVKARIAPELLKKYVRNVKTGLPGMAYVRLDPQAPWPENLQVKLPQ